MKKFTVFGIGISMIFFGMFAFQPVLNAQTTGPQYHTVTAANTNGNSIPFAFQSIGTRSQQVLPVGAFTPTPPSGMLITRVYWRPYTGSLGTGTTTYTQLHISLK